MTGDRDARKLLSIPPAIKQSSEMKHTSGEHDVSEPGGANDIDDTVSAAVSDVWHHLVQTREALAATLGDNKRLSQLVVDARELLIDAQERVAKAEARASHAEARAQVAEAALERSRSGEPAAAKSGVPMDFYTAELERLRALIGSDGSAR